MKWSQREYCTNFFSPISEIANFFNLVHERTHYHLELCELSTVNLRIFSRKELNKTQYVFQKNLYFTDDNYSMFQEWVDYNLQWNESEYGGVKDLRITPNKLWKPDILMYNR